MRRNLLALLALASGFVLLHVLTNNQYGFHRDELQTLDDARHLAWGYVAYPPLTPFLARIALLLFGPSLVGVRLLSVLAEGVAVVLTGLMAGELGGRLPAQMLAAATVAISPVSMVQGAVFQYVSFDFMWWVLVAWLTIRLLRSANPRWWLAIGIAVGLGMMTKYTMAFLAAGMAGGIVLTSARRYLKSRWLWFGVALALLIFLPNLLWQIRHDFISLDFLRYIHARDIRIGRTDDFLLDQLFLNLFFTPVWAAGLYYCFVMAEGKPYRALGWMFVIPLSLFFAAKARSYYIAPEYPMLLAAGAAVGERWLASLAAGWARFTRGLTATAPGRPRRPLRRVFRARSLP